MKFSRIALATAALVSAGAANAATVVYTSDVVDWTDTSFSTSLQLRQFDSTLGNLTSVKVTLYGTLRGDVQIENLALAATNATLTMNGTLTLTRPDDSTIVVTTPIVSNAFSLGGFDGAVDWGGTSGDVFSFVGAEASNSAVLGTLTDFGLFTGPGFVDAGLDAVAFWTADGSANMAMVVAAQATGYATVEYTYDVARIPPAVPEPATWALMVLGIGMVGVSARRRTGAVTA